MPERNGEGRMKGQPIIEIKANKNKGKITEKKKTVVGKKCL